MKIHVHLKMDEELHGRMQKLSDRQRRSYTSILECALEEYLNKRDGRTKKAKK